MLRIRWPVFVALALALLAPAPALADEVNPVEGFTGGISDLLTGESRETVADPVRDYEYEPELREVETRADDETSDDLTTLGGIQQVIDRTNQVSFYNDSNRTSLLNSVRYYLGASNGGLATNQKNSLILPAIGIVFLWWGVRKVIRMVMSAWRSGRATA